MSPQPGTRPILPTPGILSQCGISYRVWDRGDWDSTKDTRRQITECRDFFFSRLDHIAHYCCADSWRIATEKAREKAASMKNIRRAASLGLHFSTSKLLPRCWPRGTLNVRIGKKVTERNSLGVPRWTFTKISNQKSKTSLSCSARVPMKNFSYACRKMSESSHTSRDNECRRRVFNA